MTPREYRSSARQNLPLMNEELPKEDEKEAEDDAEA
jgi:hypothetical protein